jgi:hypothetical protein
MQPVLFKSIVNNTPDLGLQVNNANVIHLLGLSLINVEVI